MQEFRCVSHQGRGGTVQEGVPHMCGGMGGGCVGFIEGVKAEGVEASLGISSSVIEEVKVHDSLKNDMRDL